MASWIGASAAQRFHQYTLPAAKRSVASGWKETERQRIAGNVARLRIQHSESESEARRNKINRRIRAELNEWKRVCEAWDRDVATIAYAKSN